MSTGKAVLLFIVGIISALLTFPAAFFVSAALGYVLGIFSIVVGAYLIAKRENSRLPLVLGIVLLIIAIPSLLGTAAVHLGLLALNKTLKEITKTKTLEGQLGTPIRVDDWRITVTRVRECTYIKDDGAYYRAKTGYKLIIVTLKIENIGKSTKSASEIWDFLLVTDANRSYSTVTPLDLELLLGSQVTEKVKREAVPLEGLNTLTSVAPNTYIEGDILFQIPAREHPTKLYFKVGIVKGYSVTILLTK